LFYVRVEETAQESDLVVTVTTSKKPFLRFKDISQGVLILAQGEFSEVHEDVIKNVDKMVVSHLPSAKDAGNLAGHFQSGDIKEENIYCELKDLVSGAKKGREGDNENICLTTSGLPTLDIAIAYKVYLKALEKRIEMINLG
jgi:ornithine cyclodeaminase/alanine dehydrogenase-like protein (mu-crystallin family)